MEISLDPLETRRRKKVGTVRIITLMTLRYSYGDTISTVDGLWNFIWIYLEIIDEGVNFRTEETALLERNACTVEGVIPLPDQTRPSHLWHGMRCC